MTEDIRLTSPQKKAKKPGCTHFREGQDQQVCVSLPKADYRNRHIVLVDDVASTGRTLEEATLALTRFEPASISVLVTHALFAGDAQQRLHKVGVSHLWSTDSIPHPSNTLHLDQLLAEALGECMDPRRQ